MNRQALIQQLTAMYREYLGVAAEFVIEDAFAVIDAHPEWRPHPQLLRGQFLIALERMTPPEVPFSSLRMTITKLVNESSLHD
ncbi:MAG: hypothetical protein ACRDAM_18475 [Casimicrobium sp.]